MKNLLYVTIACMITTFAAAQDATSRAITELGKLTGRYQSAASLSFDVQYNYRLASSPEKVVETLTGKCMMKGKKCDYTIDKTRTVYDGSLVAVIYQEDSLIYLSRPALASTDINPVRMLDSISAAKDAKFTIEEKEHQLTITIDFLKDASCKQISYDIDRKSGLLSRMVQVVSSELMYEATQEAPADATPSYSIVETLFSHYSTQPISEQQFDVARYVKKEGAQYAATGDYHNYKIFVATPNL